MEIRVENSICHFTYTVLPTMTLALYYDVIFEMHSFHCIDLINAIQRNYTSMQIIFMYLKYLHSKKKKREITLNNFHYFSIRESVVH